jgi:hypothetical protein
LNLVAVANDDNDDGGPPGQKDDRDAAIGPGDDDVIQVTLEPPMPETMRGGVLRLTISPAEAVHVFNPTGTAFLADHSVVLAAPAGDLAALATGPVTIWLEGIAPCADVTVRLGYDPWPGLESAADAVHVTVSKVESVNVHGTDPETHKIPSVLGPNGNNHFVCARGTGDIVLAADISPDTPGLRDLIAWEAMGAAITCPGIGTDKRTARLASDASGRVPLTIKVAGCSAWEGTAWVVWAILNGNVAPAAWGPINSDAGLRIGTEVYAEYSCTATIEPASIIADPDRPDLAGPKAGGPPGGNNVAGEPLAGGATLKWDMSRRIARRMVVTATDPPLELDVRDQDINFPGDPVIGNDDSSTDDGENNDPYDDSPARGVIRSADRPTRPLRVQGGVLGDTYTNLTWFQEFARLEIGGIWYVISDPGPWRVEFHFMKQPVTEALWGLDVNGDGDLGDIVTEAMLGHDTNGDGDLDDDVGYWDNNGSLSANNNAGAP